MVRNGARTAIACAASPLRPAPAARDIASAGVVTGLPVLNWDGAAGAGTGAGGAPTDDDDAAAEVATERSGMTNDPSCMRSGPENEPEGVLLSHSHESNDETGGRCCGMADELGGSGSGGGTGRLGVVADGVKLEERGRVEIGFETMCESELGECREGTIGERLVPTDAGDARRRD